MSILWQHPPDGPIWIDSGGGPLLLLDNQWLGEWHGYPDPELDLGIPDDYERACAIDDSIGLLTVGLGQGLVLADEPLSTMWKPFPAIDGGLIVRWRHAPSEECVIAALAHILTDLWVPSGITIALPAGQATIFDSADSAERIEVNLALHFRPGSYTVDTAEYAPHKEIALLLHRLTLQREER